MIVHFPLLLLALALLWFPRPWLRLGATLWKRRRRQKTGGSLTVDPWRTREPGDPTISFRIEFTKFRNYLDLFRAGAGSLALAGGMGIPPTLSTGADAPHSAVLQAMVLRALILLIGLLIQVVRYESQRVSFYPAIFYLAGLSVGLCEIRGAAFAFVLVWAFNPALPNASAFLAAYAVLIVVFGHFFGDSDLFAIYAGALCFLPVVLSLLARRPLTVFTRKPGRA